jgi:hypothetical protein
MRRLLSLLALLVSFVSTSAAVADCSVLSFVTVLDGNLTVTPIPLGTARDFFLDKRVICSPMGGTNCYETSETIGGYDALGNLYTYGSIGGPTMSLWRTTPQGIRTELLQILPVPENVDPSCFLESTPGVALNSVDGWVDISARGNFSEGTPTLLRVSGLPRLLDVFATYTPTAQVAVFPAKFPDGLLEPAEGQDLLVGDVASLPDFSQAVRACSAVPLPNNASPVFIPDPLAAPPSGHAFYFLVASRGASEMRMGRALSNGHFQGRQVGGIPACAD